MEDINQAVEEYTEQLKSGRIREAYRGIMSFMSGLKAFMERLHPDLAFSALYPGYMDMTYFACTPQALKEKGLKIAIVYLHEENRFELWLSGSNRKIQAEYISLLQTRDTGGCKLSQSKPGVDSILETRLPDQPDFDHAKDLMDRIEREILRFMEITGQLIS